MLQKIKLQTPDGVREYKFLPDGGAYESAKASGEIAVGEEVIYRSFLVHILPGYEMLVLQQVNIPIMHDTGGNPGGEAWSFNPNMAGWSFTVNGVPVDPSQFMGGMKN